jgi:undecaprenyl-diphosphatase
MKAVIGRTKDGDLVYPSGHMGAAVAVALVVAMLLVCVIGLSGLAALAVLTVVPGLMGAGIGLAMTVTNYHYLTDAIGGFCIAVSVVLTLALLLDRWPPRGAKAAGTQRVPHAMD